MTKKIFLLISFFIAITIAVKLSPIQADDRCGDGWYCYGSQQSSMVWYTGCRFIAYSGTAGGLSNYCAGNGYTGDSCTCTNDECTCTIYGGIRCDLTSAPIKTCRCQQGGGTCTRNEECRDDWDGAYPWDVCGCNSSNYGCELKYGSRTWSCCARNEGGDDDPWNPTPTSGPPPTNPPPTPTNIPTKQLEVTVNFYQSSSATYNPASNSCSHTNANNYSDGVFLQSQLKSDPVFNHGLIDSHTYNFNLDEIAEGDPLTITANVQDFTYSCTCPVGCSYALNVPVGDTLTRNFYFNNYSESWFQIFGANAFTRNLLRSIGPNANNCLLPTCQAGIFVPQPANDNLSSGFPLLTSTSLNSIQTHIDSNEHLANIHLTSQRTSSQSSDGFALGFNPQALSYNYFKQLANNIGGTLHQLTPAETNLLNWRNNGWLTSSQTNFFEVNGNLTIDQSKNFIVNHGESVVVFVNGSLTIDNTGASGAKIISVARKTSANTGGFLAFFTTEDIIIRSNVGTTLDPVSLNNPAVNFNNTHLEGVFFSNQKIVVNGQEQDSALVSYPDRKLIAAGTFIGLEGIELNRQTDDNTPATESYKEINNIQALENFLYRPDLLINWPDELKVSIINWREIAPRSFDN